MYIIIIKLPVLDTNNKLIGIITTKQILNCIANYKLSIQDKIQKAVIREFKLINLNSPIKYLSKAFVRHNYVVVVGDEKYYICDYKLLLDKILNKP